MRRSSPGSVLYVSLASAIADRTAPTVVVLSPPANARLAAQPHMVIAYADAAGAGESGASGVDLATLVVRIDGTIVGGGTDAGRWQQRRRRRVRRSMTE